ncbi:MAG: hypothetical protein AMXMBFR56_74050 [Polyangiaceae bacterium]
MQTAIDGNECAMERELDWVREVQRLRRWEVTPKGPTREHDRARRVFATATSHAPARVRPMSRWRAFARTRRAGAHNPHLRGPMYWVAATTSSYQSLFSRTSLGLM